MVIFVDLQKLFIENLLWTPQVPSFVVVELYEETVEIVTLEVDVKRVPLAMRAVVVEEALAIWVISRSLRHCHLHRTGAYWTLKQSLTLIFLRLRLVDGEDIIAELAVEVVDLFLEAEAAEPLLALDT